MTLYLVERTYVGKSDIAEPHIIEICSVPVSNCLTGDVVIDGYVDTVNDWETFALGEYATIYGLMAEVIALFGSVRVNENFHNAGCLFAFYVGKYFPLTIAETSEYFNCELAHLITSESTDSEIFDLIAEFEKSMNDYCMTVNGCIIDMAFSHRDELRRILSLV